MINEKSVRQNIFKVFIIFYIGIQCLHAEDLSERLKAASLQFSSGSAKFQEIFEMANTLDRTRLDEQDLTGQIQSFSKSEMVDYVGSFLKGVDYVLECQSLTTSTDKDQIELLYNNFLRVVQTYFPAWNLNEIFYQEPKSDRSILSLGAFSRLYEAKKLDGDLPLAAITFNEFGGFVQSLDSLDVTEPVYRLALLRHTITPHEPHLTPIFAKVTADGVRYVILDTLGINYDSDIYKSVYAQANLHFVEHMASCVNPRSLSRKISLTTQKIARQKDMLSCGIFSLDDLLDFQRGDLFSELDQLEEMGMVHNLTDGERIIKGTEIEIKVLDFLPPRFMRSIQDPRTLDDYVARAPREVFGGDEIGVLDASVKSESLVLKDKGGRVFPYRNRYMFFKYTREILEEKLAKESTQ